MDGRMGGYVRTYEYMMKYILENFSGSAALRTLESLCKYPTCQEDKACPIIDDRGVCLANHHKWVHRSFLPVLTNLNPYLPHTDHSTFLFHPR